jgi:hypothetical protein
MCCLETVSIEVFKPGSRQHLGVMAVCVAALVKSSAPPKQTHGIGGRNNRSLIDLGGESNVSLTISGNG